MGFGESDGAVFVDGHRGSRGATEGVGGGDGISSCNQAGDIFGGIAVAPQESVRSGTA